MAGGGRRAASGQRVASVERRASRAQQVEEAEKAKKWPLFDQPPRRQSISGPLNGH